MQRGPDIRAPFPLLLLRFNDPERRPKTHHVIQGPLFRDDDTQSWHIKSPKNGDFNGWFWKIFESVLAGRLDKFVLR